jgi:acylphosphatase
MSKSIRQRTIFTGRVQGVGFRASTANLAAQFPITGFVQNQPDGSVLCESQGQPGDVQAFHQALSQHLTRYIKYESSTVIPQVPHEAVFTIKY